MALLRIGLLLATLFSFLKSYSQIEIIQYQLKNGLTVILNPDKSVNDITGAVAVNTGSKNDPSDATGISHYLEHLLFKGTEELGTTDFEKEKIHLDSIYYLYDQLGEATEEGKRKSIQQQINEQSLKASKYAMPNEFDRLLKSIGSTGVNATTNTDLTIYFNTFPSHQIPKWLNIYAHRFQDPVFRSFQSELEVVYEEKNRSMDNMQRRVMDVFRAEFYKGHPYGENHTLGSIEHLKNPSLTKMYQYFNDYYVANNMALILSGNFDVDEVKPFIEKEFGQLKRGKVPNNAIQKPKEFNGREVLKARVTPVKAGIYGFRTVPRYHEDEAALDVCAYLFQNQSETGLIDQMVKNNEVMMAYSFSENTDEAGNQTFVLIPKVLIQSFKNSEKQLFNQINKLKTGEFSEELLQSVKNEIYKDYQTQLEKPKNRIYLLANAFRSGKSWQEISQLNEKVQGITKEDVQRVAKKYFNENYFALLSRTGFPKKEKLEKPDFKPLKIEQKDTSIYGKKFDHLSELNPKPRFINFKKDLSIHLLGGGNSKLFVVNNPSNDIYELELKFHGGELNQPELFPLSKMMRFAHPSNTSLNEFKQQVGILGSSISFSTTSQNFTIRLSGIEKNLPEAVKKLNELLKSLEFDKNGIKAIVKEVKTERKQEEEDGLLIARALAQYGLYGDNSPLKNRLTLKEIKKLNEADYLRLYDQVKNNSVSIHFSGKTDAVTLKDLITNSINLNFDANSTYPTPLPLAKRSENELFIVDNKKLVQSHVFFVKNSTLFNKKKYAEMNLFNQYFDGGFSGILTQEVREYRSLAYSSTANYDYTYSSTPEAYFYTYLGTQADKSNAAIDLTYDLIQNMPEKPDRMDLIVKNVILKNQSSYPFFRDLSERVEALQIFGFEKEPNEIANSKYEQLVFKDLIDFYSSEIKPIPFFIGVHGDSKRFNVKELEKFGKVKLIQKEEVIKF